MSKKKHNRPQHVALPVQSAEPATEYQPSAQAEKYNIPEPAYNYKILAFRNDYIKLQEEVTKHLNDGWQLAGGLATNVHSDQYAVTTVFAQAVYRLS